MRAVTIILAMAAGLTWSAFGQEGTNAPVLLPDSAWDRPLPIRLLDLPLLDVPELGIRAYVLEEFNWTGLDLAGLDLGGLPVDHSTWLLIANRAYNAAMAAWERRWGVMLDHVTITDWRLVPHPLTPLGQARAELQRRISAEGWTAGVEAAWVEYWERLDAALGRRQVLGARWKRAGP